MDYYREHKPRSITKRYTGETDSAGNKLTEEVFAGADKLDKFFKRMPITEITALKIKDYVKWRRKEGDADPTIRGQLGNLRSAFTQAKALDLITGSHIPTFALPADSKPRKGFLDFPEFNTVREAMPAKLRPTLSCTSADAAGGAAKKITCTMIDRDCSEITPHEIIKNDEPLTIPLAGPLEEIATTLRELRKSFPKPTDPAWQLSQPQLGPLIQSSSSKMTGSTRGRNLHRLLIAGQVALTLLLMAGAGSAMKSFVALTHTPLGFDPDHVLVLDVALPKGAKPSWQEHLNLNEAVRSALEQTPGVSSAGVSASWFPPFGGFRTKKRFRANRR